MSTIKAKRQNRVTVETDLEIISHQLCTPSLDATGTGTVWIQLRRRCCVCRELFKHGDSVSLCMYMENGMQLSGGAHSGCLPDNETPGTLSSCE